MGVEIWSSVNGNVRLVSDNKSLTVVFSQGEYRIEMLIKQVMYYTRGFDKFTSRIRQFLGSWKSDAFDINQEQNLFVFQFSVKLKPVYVIMRVVNQDTHIELVLTWSEMLELADNLDKYFE